MGGENKRRIAGGTQADDLAGPVRKHPGQLNVANTIPGNQDGSSYQVHPYTGCYQQQHSQVTAIVPVIELLGIGISPARH
jgi:hypothetical protein